MLKWWSAQEGKKRNEIKLTVDSKRLIPLTLCCGVIFGKCSCIIESVIPLGVSLHSSRTLLSKSTESTGSCLIWTAFVAMLFPFKFRTCLYNQTNPAYPDFIIWNIIIPISNPKILFTSVLIFQIFLWNLILAKKRKARQKEIAAKARMSKHTAEVFVVFYLSSYQFKHWSPAYSFRYCGKMSSAYFELFFTVCMCVCVCNLSNFCGM